MTRNCGRNTGRKAKSGEGKITLELEMADNFEDETYFLLKPEMEKIIEEYQNITIKHIFEETCRKWYTKHHEVDYLTEKCTMLGTKITEQGNDVIAMQTKIESLEQRINDLITENEQHISELNEKVQDNEILLKNREKLIKEMKCNEDDNNQYIERIEKEKTELTKLITMMKDDLKEKNKYIEELENERMENIKQIKIMKLNENEKNKIIEKIEQEKTGLKIAMTALEKTIDDIKYKQLHEMTINDGTIIDFDNTIDHSKLQFSKSFSILTNERSLHQELTEVEMNKKDNIESNNMLENIPLHPTTAYSMIRDSLCM
ncbi:uncharacterized protein LOC113468579 [Diaphorina citri]|uniref:Uncharacterized protein LOC113468579 n=1 Tax=Diaphorina citri TaxID=121845 RepID=A0A3Q0J365_DIACI|nr:uncharacterized protein LOC113468579 [Diaphorina citri]